MVVKVIVHHDSCHWLTVSGCLSVIVSQLIYIYYCFTFHRELNLLVKSSKIPQGQMIYCTA